MSNRVLSTILAAGLLAGCGESPAPPPAATAPTRTDAAGLRSEGDALAARGEYAAAAERYREALRRAPEDLGLHFSLGSVLTHLGRRDEAVEQFRWVVAHGSPNRPEVATARQWLLEAGVVEGGPAPTRAARKEPSPPEASASFGMLKGNTVWPGVTPDTYRLTLQILLAGDDPFTQEKIIQARTRLGEPYVFPKVPEGTYRLMAQVGATRLWDTRITVAAGKETVLDLTPFMSPVSPSEFPLPADR